MNRSNLLFIPFLGLSALGNATAPAQTPPPPPVVPATNPTTPPPLPRATLPVVPAPRPPAAGNSTGAPSPDIGYLTADKLAQQCDDTNPTHIGYCFAYIAAVHDTMRAYEIWLEQKEFCIPANVPQGELRRAFLTYLSAYPTNRTGQAASVIAIALKQTYPCPAAAK